LIIYYVINMLARFCHCFLGLYVPENVPYGALRSISRAYGSDDMLDILREKQTEALVNAGVMEEG
jgi:hypothetical protein